MKSKTSSIILCALLFLAGTVNAAAQDLDSSQTREETTKQHPKSNLTVKEWNVDAATGQKVLDHVTIFNEKGKKVEETEYDSKGMQWRKRYEHGENGKVLREMVYNSNNKLDNVRKFEYDELGRKKAEYIYDAKGRLKKYKIYEYIPGAK